MAEFKDFVGKTCVKIDGMKDNSDDMLMTFSDGSTISMYHYQDCCESVYIADVAGDPDDLLNTPLLMCEEAESGPYEPQPGYEEWTDLWFKFRTMKGDVTLRWRGESNGSYSQTPRISLNAK
jgi:hypothetical protein